MADKNEQYEGPSRATIALGKGKVYGWIGAATGAILLGAGAALSPDKFGRAISDGAETFKRWVTRNKKRVLGDAVAEKYNLAFIGGVAAFGSFIGHYMGMIYGVRKGLDKANAGHEQFDKIKTERDDARDELGTLKEQITTLNENLKKEVKRREDATQSTEPSNEIDAATITAEKTATTQLNEQAR